MLSEKTAVRLRAHATQNHNSWTPDAGATVRSNIRPEYALLNPSSSNMNAYIATAQSLSELLVWRKSQLLNSGLPAQRRASAS
jgi:hypothetical protein